MGLGVEIDEMGEIMWRRLEIKPQKGIQGITAVVFFLFFFCNTHRCFFLAHRFYCLHPATGCAECMGVCISLGSYIDVGSKCHFVPY